jgi:hypothetical protein
VQLFGTPSKPKVKQQQVAGVVANDTQVSVDTAQISSTSMPKVLASEVVITETVTLSPEPLGANKKSVENRKPLVEKDTDSNTSKKENLAMASNVDDSITKDAQTSPIQHSAPAQSVLYTDFVSSSTSNEPLESNPLQDSSLTNKTDVGLVQLAVRPHTVLQLLYSFIAGFVLGALLLSLLIEIRHPAPMQIAYSLGLLTLMGMLFYIHITLSGGANVL